MTNNIKNKKLVTAALPYVNGLLHLGHLAGVYLPADIYARFQRLLGHEVLFISGSDEHGTAIEIKAKQEGVNPKEIVDKYHRINQKTFENMGISFDFYGRTSESYHHKFVQDFFRVFITNRRSS